MRQRLCITLTLGAFLAALASGPLSAQATATAQPLAQGGPGASTPQPSRPDFTGHWRLNAGVSDDPEARIKAAMKSMREAAGAGRGMGGGGGRQGGRGGRHGGQAGQGGAGGMGGRGGMAPGEMAALAVRPARLDIQHAEPTLVITNENEQSERLFTDFRGASVSANDPEPQRVAVAGWEGADLVVETRVSGGARLIRNYHLDPVTGQLMISTAVDHPELKMIAYRLVYDRQPPAASAGNP